MACDVCEIRSGTQMHKSGSLHCPYVKCGKVFEKPLALTNTSRTPRETYYACPYCLSKVEIVVKDEKSLNSVSVETSDNPREMPPAECPHHFGHLKNLPEDASIPDECLTCPKLIQCFIKK